MREEEPNENEADREEGRPDREPMTGIPVSRRVCGQEGISFDLKSHSKVFSAASAEQCSRNEASRS
jgi:hypothetical protein